METVEKYDFIVVDDSRLDCFIAERIIQHTARSASVKTFMSAADALVHINTITACEAGGQLHKTIILLDIQMPLMNGFEFIEAFEASVPENRRTQFCISLLSSSINETDMIKAQSYISVHRFLNKPLHKNALLELINVCSRAYEEREQSARDDSQKNESPGA